MITKEEVIEASKTAKILLKSDEVNVFTKELNDILKFVDIINEVDLEEKLF